MANTAGLVTRVESIEEPETYQEFFDKLSKSIFLDVLRNENARPAAPGRRARGLRALISTLQDLSFVVDKADLELGTVSATKLSGYQLRMTATVHPRGATQLMVRANAQFMTQAVEEPKPCQELFRSLEKAMFLTAHEAD